MATEKDFVKRIVKENGGLLLYHELYDVTAHVVYVPHEKQRLRAQRRIQNYRKT